MLPSLTLLPRLYLNGWHAFLQCPELLTDIDRTPAFISDQSLGVVTEMEKYKLKLCGLRGDKLLSEARANAEKMEGGLTKIFVGCTGVLLLHALTLTIAHTCCLWNSRPQDLFSC